MTVHTRFISYSDKYSKGQYHWKSFPWHAFILVSNATWTDHAPKNDQKEYWIKIQSMDHFWFLFRSEFFLKPGHVKKSRSLSYLPNGLFSDFSHDQLFQTCHRKNNLFRGSSVWNSTKRSNCSKPTRNFDFSVAFLVFQKNVKLNIFYSSLVHHHSQYWVPRISADFCDVENLANLLIVFSNLFGFSIGSWIIHSDWLTNQIDRTDNRIVR